MTVTHNSNAMNHRHKDEGHSQGKYHETREQQKAADLPGGSGSSRLGAQHCLFCQAETVGACLICHRPLCEPCGESLDDFLRCPSHHEREVEELRSTLRQAALAVINTKHYVKDLVALRNRVLHEVSTALLRSYVEHIGGVPSPSHIQQMRRVAVALWNSLSCVEDGDASLLMDTAGSSHEQKERVREGHLTGQEEMRPPEKEGPV